MGIIFQSNVNDFIDAQSEYFTLQKQGKQITPGSIPGRIVGGALGKVGEGIERVGETFAPETTQKARETLRTYKDIVQHATKLIQQLQN